MILKYGSYTHDAYEVDLAEEVEHRPGQNGLPSTFVARWHLSGKLFGTDGLATAAAQAEMTTKIQTLRAAYFKQFQDAIFYLADGTTKTAHALLNAGSIGGVRVVHGPDFPTGQGAEYVRYRTYNIVLEAEYPAANSSPIIHFFQSITFRGGGMRWLLQEARNGVPKKELISEATSFWAFQRGHSLGSFTYPTIPSPLWPEHEHTEQREINQDTPMQVGAMSTQNFKNYPVSWSYVFESDSPF